MRRHLTLPMPAMARNLTPMKPNLRRNTTLQRTPTLASLLCELRAQRPDLVEQWSDGEVGTVLSPQWVLHTKGKRSREIVAAEFGDRVLSRRGRKQGVEGVWFFSPLLAEEIFTAHTDIALPAKRVARRAA